MKPDIYLSVVIPAYNEADRIPKTLDSVLDYLSRQTYFSEVIVVVNNSTDDTVGVVQKYADINKSLSFVEITKWDAEGGTKGYAVREGMKKAVGKYRLFMDADNATDLSEVEKLWQYFESGVDVVIGSRYVNGSHIVIYQPWYRRLLGRVGNLVVRILLLPGIRDTQCGFKAFTAESAERIFKDCQVDGWGADIEMLGLARKFKMKTVEVPIVWTEIGQSRFKLNAFWHTLKELVAIRGRLKHG